MPKTEPTEPVPVTRPTILLAPIIEYPAYIHDQCGTLWGIPANLQGEGHKELIHVQTADGAIIPASELDFFTIDGVMYLVHTYQAIDSTGASVAATDYYRQERAEIEQECEEDLPQAVTDIYRFWIAKRGHAPIRHDEPRIGRNDACPCGSGKKFKQCCGKD